MTPQERKQLAAKTDILLLAAGRGERLRPLTDTIPKPLVKVGPKELITWNLERIARAGFSRVFINLHYRGDQIREFVGDGGRFGLQAEYSEEPVLLDTGGAIKNIEPRLKSDSLVTINSDILLGEDFELESVLESHTQDPRKPLATLVLRPDKDAEKFGLLELDERRRITRFLDVRIPAEASEPQLRGIGTPESGSGSEVKSANPLMYLGVQVISRRLIESMPDRGAIFSITRDVYRDRIRRGEILGGVLYSGYWSDVGTPDRLSQASNWVNTGI